MKKVAITEKVTIKTNKIKKNILYQGICSVFLGMVIVVTASISVKAAVTTDTSTPQNLILDNGSKLSIGTGTVPEEELLVAGRIRAVSFRTKRSFEWTSRSAWFGHNSANKVAYIDFGEGPCWGTLEITLTDAWNYGRTTGRLTKIYDIAYKEGGVYSSGDELTAALGPVCLQWRLGVPETGPEGQLRIPIYHISNVANHITVQVKGVVTYGTGELLQNLKLTAPEELNHNQTAEHISMGHDRNVGIGTRYATHKLTVNGSVMA
ncbi:MAG: hypothetical protein GY718_09275, partial [Lentisphaerae bacterium]|nr:hypothetical protein [Lentisphaerota bacterium]